MLQSGLLIIGLANVSESLGLFFWIYFAERGDTLAGIVALLVGLLVERISVYLTIHQVFGENPPHKAMVPTLALTAVMEMVTWLVWLAAADGIGGTAGHLIAFVGFSAVTVVVHSIQGGYIVQTGAFAFVQDAKTIVFSVIEAATGALFLLLYRDQQVAFSAILLFAGISLEHFIQASKINDVPEIIDAARQKRLPIA